MRHFFAVTLFATLTACALPGAGAALEPLDAEALQDTLTELIATHPTANRTNVALKVTDLETGEVLFDQNSDKLFTPASNLKIYTSAAALDLLGPEYRWTTEIGIKGQLDDSGTLTGGVWFVPGGDPMLDTEQLLEITDDLVNKSNLTRIEQGGITLLSKPTWQAVPIKGPGWMWDDDPDYYNMSIRSVMLNFNVQEVLVGPGEAVGDEVQITLNPPPIEDSYRHGGPYLRNHWADLPARARTAAKGTAAELMVDRDPFTERILVSGNLPIDAEPKRFRVTMHDPNDWVLRVFGRMLIDAGVEVDNFPDENHSGPLSTELRFSVFNDGKSQCFADVSPEDADRALITHQGKANAEAVKHFLKKSENAVGEMLLLTLSEKFGEGDKVSWPSGAKVISDWLVDTAGLERDSFRLVDGSGLSRYNLISADSSIRLLSYMKNQSPHFGPFFDGLPVYEVKLPGAAEDGAKWGEIPLAEFDAERVFAKPGGMSGVSTISGYVKTLDGRWLAFSLLGNGYIGSSAPVRDLRNQVWAELVRYQPAEAAVPAD